MKRDGDKICSISVILSHHAVSLLRVSMIIVFNVEWKELVRKFPSFCL